MESGFWFLVKNYPSIVSEGFRLATDSPCIPPLRHDPEGERKLQEQLDRQRESAEMARPTHISADEEADLIEEVRKIVPRRRIYLQWHDRMYDRWVDTSIVIDLEAIRIFQCASWMLGRQHEGSGAIGVILFAAPILVVSTPYLWVKNRASEAQERKAGMSRHAIALMKALESELSPEDEALLHQALQNEWSEKQRLCKKFGHTPTFEEACALLDACEMRVHTYLKHRPKEEHRKQHFWIDKDGDVIGRTHSFSDENGPFIEVKNTLFEGKEAKELMKHFDTYSEE